MNKVVFDLVKGKVLFFSLLFIFNFHLFFSTLIRFRKKIVTF